MQKFCRYSWRKSIVPLQLTWGATPSTTHLINFIRIIRLQSNAYGSRYLTWPKGVHKVSFPTTNSWDDDPRLTGEHVRVVAGSNGVVTLAGVVHDHPASKYRVARLIEGSSADILALELPPLALPLFKQYAADERMPPAFGGEMSLAIQAADSERIVGIDGPSRSYLSRVSKRLVRDRASPRTIGTVTKNLLSVSKETLTRRAASIVHSLSSIRLELDKPTVYETDWTDEPAVQAADEQRQIGRAQSVSNLLEHSRGESVRDATREAHMAAQLDDLRKEGDVVAVVGRGHLDAITEQLIATTET